MTPPQCPDFISRSEQRAKRVEWAQVTLAVSGLGKGDLTWVPQVNRAGGQCGNSPGGPLIPVGPRLPVSPLGPVGPGSPRAPTRSGGKEQEVGSSGTESDPHLAWSHPSPAPLPAPTISREQWGPRVLAGSREPWGSGIHRGQSHPESPAPRSSLGRVCAELPRRPTGGTGRLRPSRGRAVSQRQGRA